MSSETRSRSQELLDVEQRFLAPVLARSSNVVIDHARGSYMWSVDGQRYLDFAMGIATVNTGHCHPRVVEAARAQLEKLVHPAATVAHYEANIRLVEKLATITPGDLDVTFLTNSGAEAVESATKLARYATGRTIIIAFQGGFHGRTYCALTVTSSKVHYREGYEPFVPSTYIMPFPYSLRCQLGHDCRHGCVGACSSTWSIPTRWPPWWSSRCKARAATSCHRPGTSGACARSATATASSCWPTRFRAALAGRGSGSPASTSTWCPTCRSWPKASPRASRWPRSARAA